MKTQNTPWAISKVARKGSPAQVVDQDGHIVANLPAYTAATKGAPCFQARNHNARLIAAAPALQAELEKAHRFLRKNGYEMADIDKLFKEIADESK